MQGTPEYVCVGYTYLYTRVQKCEIPTLDTDTRYRWMVSNIIVNTDTEVGDAALYGVGHCRYRY
jgi:hypothetical protein